VSLHLLGTFYERVHVYANFSAGGNAGVSFIGDGASPLDARLTYNLSGSSVGTFGSFSVTVDAADFVASNVAFVNDADGFNKTRAGQSVALGISGDRAALLGVALLGGQDTLYAANARVYLGNAFVNGSCDSIFGLGALYAEDSAIAIFDTVTAQRGNGSTAYLFEDCDISPAAPGTLLGRPWGLLAKTIFKSCVMSANVAAPGWSDWGHGCTNKSDPLACDNVTYAEFNSTGPGAPIPGGRVWWSQQLDASAAALWNRSGVLSGWNPLASAPVAAALRLAPSWSARAFLREHGAAREVARPPAVEAASKPLVPGEVWSAGFVFNSTASNGACTAPLPDATATFYVARWQPAAADAYHYHINMDAFAWPTVAPIHTKTLLFSGQNMATDAAGRRGWALFGTSTWTAQSWLVQLSFPADDFNSSAVTGVCELIGVGSTYSVGTLQYNAAVSADGVFALNSTVNASGFASTAVVAISVPALKPRARNIPPCTVQTVATITDPAFSINTIPSPIIGTDRRSAPLAMVLQTSALNASQVIVTAWSLLSGEQVYNVTWACGFPSYLFACVTSSPDWPMAGLFGAYLTSGALFFCGGSWGAQQCFQGVVPALAAPAARGEGAAGGGGGGGGDDGAAIPVLTNVNVSVSQATWLWRGQAFAPRGPGQWPLYIDWLGGGSSTCATPGYSQAIEVEVVAKSGAQVLNPLQGSTLSPGCPLRYQDAGGWWATAACAEAAIGFPDRLAAH
jgi:pectinesterase